MQMTPSRPLCVFPALGTALSALITAASSAAAQGTVPRLEGTDCPFAAESWAAGSGAECGWLVVPMDRRRTDGPEVRLFVVVLRAEQAVGAPPEVILHGGPGVSALVPMVRGALQLSPRSRDMVFYDQRGAGLSQPDPCPGWADRVRELQADEPLGSTSRRALDIAARECVAAMRARSIDPAAFSTTANAADLADLRRALGYERWDVYGGSYGGRLALEAMRRDREGVRAVALYQPLRPGFESAEAPLSTQHVLERVFAACERSPVCNGAFPSLEQTFLALADTLARAPVTAPGTSAGSRAISLDGDGFAAAVRELLRSPEGIASLPLLLYELRSGDRTRAARELLRLAEAGSGRATRAVFWLVQCYDQGGPGFMARLDTVRASAWQPLRSLGGNRLDCPLWQTEFATPEERAPVVSDIPTLIMTGEFDPRAPVEFGRRIASTLSNARVFVIPGLTHGEAPAGCRAAILMQFLTDPLQDPDAFCIERIPPIEFRTQWAERSPEH